MRAGKVKTRNFEFSPFTFWLALEKLWQAWFLKFSYNGALWSFNGECCNSQHNAIGSWGAERSTKFTGCAGICWSWPLWSGVKGSSCRAVILQLASLENKDKNYNWPKIQLSSSNSSSQIDQPKKPCKNAICCILHPYKGSPHGSLKGKVRLKKNFWEHKKMVLEVRKCHTDIVRPIRMSKKPRKNWKFGIWKFAYM